ncbi:MAG: nucleoside 2-deoxyribosyltransferase [Oscillospiraceae bacterium]|nr:nucleoside 2-deoxyribosyltransferase [Oscillospiraceae bacterium]
MDIEKVNGLIIEIGNLKDKVEISSHNNEYIYTNVYSGWLKEYNALIERSNEIAHLNLSTMTCNQWDLSSTHKTVKNSSVESFIKMMEKLISNMEDTIEAERLKVQTAAVPAFQMRRCFKLGLNKCPLNPSLNNKKVFIAMPFDDSYLDSYIYGVVPALETNWLAPFKADNEISNKDIMCKICNEIQSSKLAIVNISGLNPNVMLELGLAYGIGKPVIIIKNKATTTISDLGNIEYIEYAHAVELRQKLTTVLEKYQ